VADLGFMLRVVGNHNGFPEQELQTLKKSQSFEFLFICLNNLKFVITENQVLSKVLILAPLGVCCSGQPHHSLHPDYAHHKMFGMTYKTDLFQKVICT
jgi:hypothetical protein